MLRSLYVKIYIAIWRHFKCRNCSLYGFHKYIGWHCISLHGCVEKRKKDDKR